MISADEQHQRDKRRRHRQIDHLIDHLVEIDPKAFVSNPLPRPGLRMPVGGNRWGDQVTAVRARLSMSEGAVVPPVLGPVLARAPAAALQVAFVTGWWIDASSVLLALALGALVGAGLRRVDQRRRARNLARYQSPALVEMLATLAEPLRHRRPRHAVVLFVDVAGFTTHAEHLGPRRTDAFLSLFHHLVERAADPHGGIIAHFAGDGALVVFGLPEPAADDADRALAFIDRLFAAVRDSPDWPGLGLRVGGHAGPVQLGVLGGARHRHVSVSGDVVNAASRLQEFARSRNASLGLSDALVTSGPAATRWAGRVAEDHRAALARPGACRGCLGRRPRPCRHGVRRERQPCMTAAGRAAPVIDAQLG